jgi:hypothetical protein
MVIVSRGLVKSGNAIGTRLDVHMKLRNLARSSKSLGRLKATTSNGEVGTNSSEVGSFLTRRIRIVLRVWFITMASSI